LPHWPIEISSDQCRRGVDSLQSAGVPKWHLPAAKVLPCSKVKAVSRMRRRVPWFLVLLLPVLTGCPDEQQPAKHGSSLPFAGQEIHIGVPADRDFRTLWEAPLNEWAAQSGARYSLTELPPAAPSEPYAGLSGDEGQTLAIFPLDRAGELLGAGSLAAVPQALLEDDENGVGWRDLFAGLSKLASRKGTALFVPLACPVLVCYYRDDLLNAAGLNPPQTWVEYQQLVDKLDVWAPGLTVVEPWSESFGPTMFLARAVALAQHPGHYSLFFDVDTGAPLIDTPGFIRALELSQAAIAKMPAEVLFCEPDDCRKAILRGTAALAVALESPSSGGAAETALERPAGMRIGFVRLPGSRETWNPTRRAWEPLTDKGTQRVTLCGFSGLAVAASSRNSTAQTEASWNALARVRGQNFVSGFPAGIVGLCRESQLQNPAEAAGPGLEAAEAEAYAGAVAASLRDARLVAELPVAGRVEFRNCLARVLSSCLAGSQTAEEALQEAGRGWREIVERIGAAKIRNNYRASLGLSPR
jgi:ABC-type glycerol-3-phosphate transport system substrate-binding protein